ncbi:MAG TPA: type II toxin-antitoxin system VapC family toxin [Microbacterium sp.]|nr:type II toxin-antitoxin system VapC family toxin [Microbacterium sp.]
MIVLDTSAAIELLLGLPLARKVQQQIELVEWNIAAPQLLEIEILQVLRRRVAAGFTTLADADEARQLLLDLNVRYFDRAPLSERIWQLRENLTAYDASYVALAEALGVPLLTSDARIVRAPGHDAGCILVE